MLNCYVLVVVWRWGIRMTNRNVRVFTDVLMGVVLEHKQISSSPASTKEVAVTATGTSEAGVGLTASTTPLKTPSLSPATNHLHQHQYHRQQKHQEQRIRQYRPHKVHPNRSKGDSEAEVEHVHDHNRLGSGLPPDKAETNIHLKTVSVSASAGSDVATVGRTTITELHGCATAMAD